MSAIPRPYAGIHESHKEREVLRAPKVRELRTYITPEVHKRLRIEVTLSNRRLSDIIDAALRREFGMAADAAESPSSTRGWGGVREKRNTEDSS